MNKTINISGKLYQVRIHKDGRINSIDVRISAGEPRVMRDPTTAHWRTIWHWTQGPKPIATQIATILNRQLKKWEPWK